MCAAERTERACNSYLRSHTSPLALHPPLLSTIHPHDGRGNGLGLGED
jgi:hypothetical protein